MLTKSSNRERKYIDFRRIIDDGGERLSHVMFRLADVNHVVPVHSACDNVDDELRRHVPFALKDLILEDGARVVAVIHWDRDAEAFLEPATSRAFVRVRARVLAMLRHPGQTCIALPKNETSDGTTAVIGSSSVIINNARCVGRAKVRVRLLAQKDDDAWEAELLA